MKQPTNYAGTQAYGDFKQLTIGGKILRIMGVEETQSSTGKDMVKISLDIAEGDERDYFTKAYKSDTREKKRWGCVVNQLVYDDDGKTSRGFKTFMTSVKESNAGFSEVWGEGFAASLKNKFVGGVFRREQYENFSGELKWAVKCHTFRSVDSIREGVGLPEDKPLVRKGAKSSFGDVSGFTEMEDSVLPF